MNTHISTLLLASSIALLLSTGSACDAPKPTETAQRQSLQTLFQQPHNVDPSKEVIATVNGSPITHEAFLRQLNHPRNYNRTKNEVLDDLILAILLQDDALSQGYGDDPEILDLHKQLTVQAYVRDTIEAPNTPESITTQEARAYYDTHAYLYKTPAMRTVDHLLVAPSSKQWDLHDPKVNVPPAVFEAAFNTLQDIRKELLTLPQPVSSEDLQTLAAAWRPKLPKELEIVVDLGIKTPRREMGEPGKPGFIPSTVEPFAAQTFALRLNDPPSAPVRTRFGTHTILLRNIEPEDAVPFATAQPNIQLFLSQKRRRDAFETTLKRLTSVAAPQIRVDRDAVAKLSAHSSTQPTP